MVELTDLFDLDEKKGTSHQQIFEDCRYAWNAIDKIPDYISFFFKGLDKDNYHQNNLGKVGHPSLFQGKKVLIDNSSTIEGPLFIEEQSQIYPNVYIGKNVFIGKKCRIFPGAFIGENVIIGDFVEVRPGAYIRNDVIIGNNVVVGNSTELKNCLLFNNVEVPHFNYVGDSILGYKAHLGAGVKTSNLKVNREVISIKVEGKVINTGRRKLGAIIGDNVEIGCNAVVNPGTIIGKSTLVYPNVSLKGVIGSNLIVKLRQDIQISQLK